MCGMSAIIALSMLLQDAAMTAPVNHPRRKPGPKPNPHGAKMVRIPGELLPVVEELKKLVRQQRKEQQP